MNDLEFQRFVQDCREELQRKQEAIAEIALLQFDLQFDQGRITYTVDGTLFIDADIVLIGSRGLSSSTWLWGWANSAVGENPDPAIGALRELKTLTGRDEFGAERPFPASEEQAWNYAAIACRHLGGAGVARVTANDSDWFFVLRGLQRHRPEEEIAARAEAAVHESLRAARGPALLNVMRKRFPELRVNLIDADLRGAPNPWAHDLHGQILFEYDDIAVKAARETYPDDTITPGRFAAHQLHDLSGANFSNARLDGAILRGVTLRGASLDGASLVDADLSRADLRGASLRSAFLNGTNLTDASLADADLTGAGLSRTLLADVDVSRVKGLDEVHHFGPSEISMSTLIASNFQIDPRFLRNAGVSRGLIDDLRHGKRFADSYDTCFLSYSSKDREFAMQLYRALNDAGVRVFWDYFDVVPGEALEAQIGEAIRELRRLVVVLSTASMASDWVVREIQLGWVHRRESLLPIRLCPIEDVKEWTARQADFPDLANLLPIQDFSDWANPPSFEHALSLLLKGLGGSGAIPRRPDVG
jgi:uncharacterized protein YjbI with pentapeptide repeats